MSSILLDGPAVEPVSLAKAKAYLRVEHGDDDDTIVALIAGARIHVEAQTCRALITQTWRLSRDSWPASARIAVLPAPLRELAAVQIYKSDGATQAIDPDVFAIDKASAPAVLAFERGALPAPGRIVGGIELDVEVGYGDAPSNVPEPLRHAIRVLVAHWYENRGLIAAGQSVAVLPDGVNALIKPYRVLSL
jgi:uncharacterized phiE125 gp8 family phage protein